MGDNWLFLEGCSDGKSLITILESFGGKNELSYTGEDSWKYYYIEPETSIIKCVNKTGIGRLTPCNTNHICLSVESFKKAYPFMIGDEVSFFKAKGRIRRFKWDSKLGIVKFIISGYKIKRDLGIAKVDELSLISNKEKEFIPEILIPKIDLTDNTKDRYKIILGNYEIEEKDGELFAVRKQLTDFPNNYYDCARIIDKWAGDKVSGYKCELLLNLQKLFICRDAYWKIAGEQLGLEEPWQPDWENKENTKYCITTINRQIKTITTDVFNYFLAFPTAEIRDAFYNNFKDMIELCKSVL